MLVSTRITYRRLWLLGKLLRLEDRERYWGLLDTNDDPVALAYSSEACGWCGMPSVFGCCTALCRCPECRKQGEFVQLRLPLVGGGEGMRELLLRTGAILAALGTVIILLVVAAAFGAALAVYSIYLGTYGGIR